MSKLTKQQAADIRRNKREGLLCACNALRVPYEGHEPDHAGCVLKGETLHGYTDCAPMLVVHLPWDSSSDSSRATLQAAHDALLSLGWRYFGTQGYAHPA